MSRTISSALPRVMIPSGQRVQRAAEPGGQVPRHGQQPVRRGPGLAQREGQLVPGELVHHGGHLPRRRLEPVLGVPAEHLRDRHQLAGGHVRLGPVEGAHQPDQLMIGHPAERVTRPVAGVQRGVGGHRQLRAARRHIPRHPGPEPGRPARRLTREDPRRPGLPRPPPPRARRIQREPLIDRPPRRPRRARPRSARPAPGGGALDSGSQYSCGASDGSSSWAHSRSSHASRSAAVIGSRSSQAGSPSRPGSAGAGTEGMDHIRSAEVLFFEHDTVSNPRLPVPLLIPNRYTNVTDEVQGTDRGQRAQIGDPESGRITSAPPTGRPA